MHWWFCCEQHRSKRVKVLDVCAGMCHQVIRRQDLEAMQQQLQQALQELEVAALCQTMYIKTHTTIHMV